MSKPVVDHSAEQVLLKDGQGRALFAYGNTAPADGALGYSKGCLFLDTNASAGSILLCNEGDHTSADFDAVTVG